MYLFCRGHACGKQRDHWEHVLQWVDHGHKGHHRHWKCIIISGLQYNLQPKKLPLALQQPLTSNTLLRCIQRPQICDLCRFKFNGCELGTPPLICLKKSFRCFLSENRTFQNRNLRRSYLFPLSSTDKINSRQCRTSYSTHPAYPDFEEGKTSYKLIKDQLFPSYLVLQKDARQHLQAGIHSQ